MKLRASSWVIIGAVLLGLWVFLALLPSLYLDWLWFGEVNYRQIFWGMLLTKVNLGLVFGVAFFAVVMANAWLARRLAPASTWYEAESRFRRQAAELFEFYVNRYLMWGLAALVGLIAYGVGTGAAHQWEKWLWYRHATPFEVADPIFHNDVAFYVFRLPFLYYLWQWFYLTMFAVLIIAAAVHYLDKAIRVLGGVPAFAPHVKAHLSVIIGVILLTKAVGYQFDAWHLLYSPRGATFGVSYTDFHAQLPALRILMWIAAACALGVMVNIYFRGLWLPIFGLGLLIVASLLINVLYPAAIQRFQVQPNEFHREEPFIAHTLRFTRQAYQLDQIQVRTIPELDPLDAADLAAHPEVVENIRLWDWGPLLETYRKLQELRPYYRFLDVDIDRYTIDGEYRQVMLAARELWLEGLPTPSRTWQNLHLSYTHGYGLVLSPVNRVTAEGLPWLLVSDVPTHSEVPEIQIARPQIYFGESDILYSIVNTKEEEVDYPKGDETITTRYQGTGGILLNNSLTRTAASLRFRQINILVSGAITPESRLLINRNIAKRARMIAPFLQYDNDPYLVVGADGTLYWIHDAYTVTGLYPYSAPPAGDARVNYVRNSVKVVTDAYDGTVTFYVSEAEDPIIRTYASAFPGAFRPLEDMPEDLRAHLRWPEGIFMLQSSMYTIYHMVDPRTYYFKEDQWEIPRESAQKVAMARAGEEAGRIPAYYIVTRLPGEERAEFILIRPYTPLGKPNMIAWLAARADAPHYGELVDYRFPRDQTVFGPGMVEARIEQNTEISAALTLWRGRGSDVIRGNLLVIPIGQSLLYLEPLFLRAQEGELPELKRVIIAVGTSTGDATVVMGETLEAALEAALGAPVTEVRERVTPVGEPIPEAELRVGMSSEQVRLLTSALGHLEAAEQRLRAGDLAAYEREMKAMAGDLRQLRQTQR